MNDKNAQSRKWLLTLNNPAEKGYTHKRIRDILASMKSVSYTCMADEIGLEEQTPHTHIFIAAKSPIRFSTIKKRFPEAHIDMAQGTSEEVKAYVEKSGKWADDPKADTRVEGTFEEWGDMPEEHQGNRTDWDKVYKMLEDGRSVMEVIRDNTAMMRYRSTLEQMRQELIAEQFRDIFRLLETTYIYGQTALGKTRYVMDTFGYGNVCQITGYQRGCFDKYQCEDVILFDEFASSLKIQEMNNLLDGYPLELPCRYSNKVACYTKAFIISNIPLEQQYPMEKFQNRTVWDAFIRRIHKVLVFYAPGEFDTFTIDEYFQSLPPYLPERGIG